MKVRRLYTLYCLALPWRFKIGIAYNVEDRTAQIQGELSREIGRQVYVRQALAVPVLFPERTERWMHQKFAVLRAKVPYHRGHTEWFTIRNYATAFIWLFWLGYSGGTMTISRVAITAFLFLVPFPLDGVLLQVVVAVAQVAAGLFGLYLALCVLGAVFSS